MKVQETRVRRALVALLVGAVLVSMAGCPNLSRDLDLKAQIQGDVLEANAEQVPIRVQPESEAMGVTSPFGATTAKVGVAFQISTTVSPEYAFLRWEQAGGDGEVVFADATKPETEATVTKAGTGIVIVAMFDARPAVIIKDPDGGEGILRNRKITITFSEPVDPSTVNFETISVEQRSRSIPNDPLESIVDRMTLSVNQAVAMISHKVGEEYDLQHYVWIKVSKGVKDLAGNMMKEDFSWYFITGDVGDTILPVLNSFTIKDTDGVTVVPPDGRTKSRQGLKLVTDASDNYELGLIWVKETALTDIAGAPITGTPIETQLGYEVAHSYDLQTSADGRKEIEVSVTDTVGNRSAATRSSTIILDTTGPTATSFSATCGAWTKEVTVPILHAVSDGGALGCPEALIQVSFRVGAGAWQPWQAFSATQSAPISGDGAIAISAKYRDELGNETSAASIAANSTMTINRDGSAPAFSSAVAINGGGGTTTATSVTVAISATDALSGIAEYRLSESATFADSPVWTPWTGSPQSAPFTLSAGDGAKTVHVQLKDVAGNVSTESVLNHDSISLDQEAPTFSAAIQINGGNAATANTAVTLTISATDAGSSVAEYQLSEDAAFVDSTTTGWRALTPPYSFMLSGGDGSKTVYVRLKDANGHISTEAALNHDSITLDTAVPTFSSAVQINSGDGATSDPDVTLSIAATDALSGIAEYRLSESATFAAGPTTTAWTAWTGSPQSAPFTLSTGDGAKTVYVQLKDAAGNVSTEAVLNHDSITLDTAVPTFSSQVAINSGATTTTSTAVTLSISATDALTSIAEYQLSESATFAAGPTTTAWLTWTPPYSFTLSAGDGAKTVYVRLKDVAGNVSTEAALNHDSISLDEQAPIFSSQVAINSGATTTTSTAVTLSISASDAGSSIAEYQLSESATFAAGPTTTAWLTWTPTPSFTLSTGDGAKTVYARLKDANGHISTEGTLNHDSISLDQEAPSFSAQVQINGGDAATSDPDVTVTISATDAGSSISQYQLSESATFAAGPTTTAWTAWTPTPSYTLSTGDASKTVYARLKDANGHISTEATLNHDDITLDTTAPVITEVRMSDTTDTPPYNVKNGYAFVTFNEDIYGDAALGGVSTSALTVVVVSGSAEVQSESTTRTGAREATVAINWKSGKEPATGNQIRVETNGATAIYDALGNAMADGVGAVGTAKRLSIQLPPASGGTAVAAIALPSSTGSGSRRILPLASIDPVATPARSAQVPPRPTPRAAPQLAMTGVEPLAQFHRPVAVAAAPAAVPRDPAPPRPQAVAEAADGGSPGPVARVARTVASTALPEVVAVPGMAQPVPEERRASSIPMVGVFILGAVLLLIFGWLGAAFLRNRVFHR